MNNEKTVVIFRTWNDAKMCGSGTVIALFPELPSDYAGRLCDSYEHVGQHGGADYQGVVAATRPAIVSEYVPLHRELTARGYDLRVMNRLTPRMRENYQRNLAVCNGTTNGTANAV
jgi:hypothetical protein